MAVLTAALLDDKMVDLKVGELVDASAALKASKKDDQMVVMLAS